jgi:hypothetical protein
MDLFGNEDNSATFSECGNYRYSLFRFWDRSKPFVIFIGLNPSTANEQTDDPTIRRVKKLADGWGYGGICMMNLFAWVTPYPNQLKQVADPIGENDKYLKIASSLGVDVILAWGNFDVFGRDQQVVKMFPEGKALVINKNGSPMHPLYVPTNVIPIKYL